MRACGSWAQHRKNGPGVAMPHHHGCHLGPKSSNKLGEVSKKIMGDGPQSSGRA